MNRILKKTMLQASMSLAAIAFAAPVAAQANIDWDATGAIAGTGELTPVSQTGLSTGPATVHFTGNATKGSTTGTITTFTITGPVATNVPGCTAIGTTANLPWVVHLNTPDTMVLTNVTYTYHYSGASCAGAGIPPTIPIDGTITLTATGARAASANPYNDSGVLGVEPNTVPGVDTRGTITWAGPGITGL